MTVMLSRRFLPPAALVLGALAAGCGDTVVAPGTTTTTSGSGGTGGTLPTVTVLDGGGEPATPPDGVAACPGGACNYQTNEGCSAAAPSCLPYLDPSTHTVASTCFPAGSGTSGAACAQVADCAPGYVCAEKQCRKLCCGGDWTGCPGAHEHCLRKLEYSDPTTGKVVDTGAMICNPVDDCDPLAPASCAESSKACLVADATGAVACLPPGAGGEGGPCPCQGGFVCIAEKEGATPACRKLCGTSAQGTTVACGAGLPVCVHYTRDPPGVGECVSYAP